MSGFPKKVNKSKTNQHCFGMKKVFWMILKAVFPNAHLHHLCFFFNSLNNLGLSQKKLSDGLGWPAYDLALGCGRCHINPHKCFEMMFSLRVQVPPEKGFNPPKTTPNIFLGGVWTLRVWFFCSADGLHFWSGFKFTTGLLGLSHVFYLIQAFRKPFRKHRYDRINGDFRL